MKSRSTGESPDTVPITFRLACDDAALLQRKADAALMSRSAYIASCLSGEQSQFCPAIAALGRVIAIHELVQHEGRVDDDTLAELRAIIAQLATLARAEAA